MNLSMLNHQDPKIHAASLMRLAPSLVAGVWSCHEHCSTGRKT